MAADGAALTQQLAALEALAQGEPAALQQHRRARWRALHAHHLQHSRWYRERLEQAGLPLREDGVDLDASSRLAAFTRADLQRLGDAAFTPAPPEHGAVQITQTSGSTGEPVRIARTEHSHRLWLTHGLREHRWWQRDMTQPMMVMRANLAQPFIGQRGWGPPASLVGATGAGYAANVSLATRELAGLMRELKPAYLLAYPSVVGDLLLQFTSMDALPHGLQQVRTMGETVSDELRARVQAAWGVPIVDTYSSQECGVMMIQCPQGEGYHVMAESLHLEVLAADGTPCLPGQTGQVVVTDFENYATPVIRYAIGDMARAGGECRCGCRLPMVRSIEGRHRNLFTYPDGQRRWPRVGFASFRDIAPVSRYQVIQKSLDRVEVRVVCPSLSARQASALKQVVAAALGHPFEIEVTCLPQGLPPQTNGKHEEVVSRLVNQPSSEDRTEP